MPDPIARQQFPACDMPCRGRLAAALTRLGDAAQVRDECRPWLRHWRMERRASIGDRCVLDQYGQSVMRSRANNSRPISMRRISLVPAPISYSLASRSSRPVG